jgi:hypothetical protein
MSVMYLYKHSFNLLAKIYCQKGYEMHSRKSVTFLEIYAINEYFPNNLQT